MQQCVICILDLLGTKGIWTEESAARYFKAIDEVEAKFVSIKEEHKQLLQTAKMEFDFMSFSDTLVITLMKTEEDKEKDPYFFHEVIADFSRLILGTIQIYLANSFFVRGAVSFGNMEKRGNHFIGPAVDDAAEYFELPDMIGVCFTPKATIAMDYAIEWQKKFFNNSINQYVIKYKTPMKNKTELELYQINWIKHFFDDEKRPNEISAEASLSIFLSKRNIPQIATSKFVNTIKFFNEIGKNYR
jgi:hypothetical protein